ncbi:hypothetical protein [Hyphomicrobium sp.]|jgi:hypothetical protein|uniref:hypothetical protein n=1 Tax=Hyphomicrobium sp. TaxID=82 RepID=UPI002B5E168A|nr:hypothetical protein [Hyphomicrobium sp.]HVZ04393.1 hypothetical protein [Hyphomicrobium sp.]
MSESGFDLQILRARMAGIGERLDSVWSEKLRDHRHLDRGTKECAYWHSGYHQALADLLCLIEGPQPIYGSGDTSNPCRAAG